MGFEKRADYQNPGGPRYLTVAPKGQAIEMVLWEAPSPTLIYLRVTRSPAKAGPSGELGP